jgi:hypothetical protein
MTKRRGPTSNNGFIFQKINENENIKEKKISCGQFLKKSHLSTFIHSDKHLDGALGTL